MTCEQNEMSLTVVGDVACSHWINHSSGTYEGKPTEVNARFTDIYRKINGKWLILQEHISIPADLDTGKYDLMSKP